MRAARYSVCVLLAIALAWPASAADLTADEVVDRMLAGNWAWLRPDITHLSYVIDESARQGRGPGYCATRKVYYRAPRDLRVDAEPGHRVKIFLDGRQIPTEAWIGDARWSARSVRDMAMAFLVFRGGAWALANYRDTCEVSNLRREQVDGRNAYHVTVSGYSSTNFPIGSTASPTDCHHWRELWIDAETFRPLREGWDDGCTGEPHYSVVRYADWRPFPGGGEAPMRLEFAWMWPENLPFDADFPREPSVRQYRVAKGKYWLCESDRIRDLSTAALPDTVFNDPTLVPGLERLGQLYVDIRTYEQERRLDDLYRAVDEIVSMGMDVERVANAAFTLYFWRGEYEKAIKAALIHYTGEPLYVAWAFDAVGDREEALERYRNIARGTDFWGRSRGEEPEVKQGLKQPWVPIAKRLEPAKDERLLEAAATWRVTTNVPGSDPQAAIDGSGRTGWASDDPQEAGMWFEVDLAAPTRLSRVAFDFVNDFALAWEDYGKYPRRHVVELSSDGRRWEAVAEGPGLRDNLVNAPFKPQQVRYVRIRQEGSAEYSPWAISEIFFYAPT